MNDYIVPPRYPRPNLNQTITDNNADITALTAGGYNQYHLPRKNRRGGRVGLLNKSTFNLISKKHLLPILSEVLLPLYNLPKHEPSSM